MIRKGLRLVYTMLIVLCLYGCDWMQSDSKSENENEINLVFEEKESSEVKSEMDFSQGDLYTMFAEVNNEEIENFLYNDYNKDGLHEAFVVTKKEDVYNLWYMSPTECKVVLTDLQFVDNIDTSILTFETRDYLLLQQSESGVMKTLVYSLDNENMVNQSNISNKGYIHQSTSGELFLDVYQTTDKKKSEQKVITYYLYYMLDNGFREYGAIPISQEQFLEFAGAQIILDDIYEQFGDTPVEISYLYRANHYMNVNITAYGEDRISYHNLTLYYDNKKVSYVSEEMEEGKVETAHMLSIATFPTAFKKPQNR